MRYFTAEEIKQKNRLEITEVLKGCAGKNVKYNFTSNEAKGWRGDIGICRLNSDKIRSYGWNNQYSTRDAVIKTVKIFCGFREKPLK